MAKKKKDNVFNTSKKVVIFIHPAVNFTIDESIMSNAEYIELTEAELDGVEEFDEAFGGIMYYYQKLSDAAQSDKKYIIMEYEFAIGEIILNFMKMPKQHHFGNWQFFTFFHADTCPPGAIPSPLYNLSDEKLDVLCDLYSYPFILKYCIPPGYIIGAGDIKKLWDEFKDWGDAKDLIDFMRNRRDPLFPFYEEDEKKLKAHVRKKKAARRTARRAREKEPARWMEI